MDILKRPVFLPSVFCCAVSFVALYNIKIALALAVIFLILFIFKSANNKKYLTVCLIAALFVASLFLQKQKTDKVKNLNGETVTDNFSVYAEPICYEKFNTVILKSEGKGDLPKIKLLAFDYSGNDLSVGDIITAELKIKAVDIQSDYYFSNYGDGIYATATLKFFENTEKVNTFYKAAYSVRKYVKNTILQNLDGDAAGFLTALTIGDKTLLGETISSNIKTTGISHVVVVSGMHLSIIMSAIFVLLDKLFYNRYLRCLISVFCVVTIAAVCGFTTSVIRAGIMFVIAGLAPCFNRDSDSLNSLLTAVVLIVVSAPFTVINVSFLLSVFSTLAIIWVVPFYYRVIVNKLNIKSKILKTVINIILSSTLAMVFTLPITVKVFGFSSVVAPITNLLVTYPVTFVLVMAIIALPFYKIPFLNFICKILFHVINLCLNIIIKIVNTVAALPVTVALLPENAFFYSAFAVSVVISFMYYYNYRLKKKGVVLNGNSK